MRKDTENWIKMAEYDLETAAGTSGNRRPIPARAKKDGNPQP